MPLCGRGCGWHSSSGSRKDRCRRRRCPRFHSSRSRAAAIYRRIQALEKYAPAPPRAPELADKALFSKNGLSEQELAELREIANEMQRQRDAALKLRFRIRR